PRHAATTTSDLLSAVDEEAALPPHVREVARSLVRMTTGMAKENDSHVRRDRETDFLRAVFSGYADRVGRRRTVGSSKFVLASGHGAVLARESGVRDAEFIVAVDVQAGRRGEAAEATIRIASAVRSEWLEG